jgi:NDP-sugar pyrophosphorylase family protein
MECTIFKNSLRDAGREKVCESHGARLQTAPMTFDPTEYLDLNHTEHRMLFENATHAWDALKQITSYLQFRLKPAINGRMIGKPFVSGAVFIGKGTVVEQGAMIKGPAWIGEGCEIRNGCYIRENVIVGSGCVLGNSCEFKNTIVFDEVHVPHLSYVGDSILGYRSHIGAGVIVSNLKLDRGEITVPVEGAPVPTGLRKFGAIIGDHAEVGCHVMINPGSIIGRNTVIYPGTVWRGVAPANAIVKTVQTHTVIARRG